MSAQSWNPKALDLLERGGDGRAQGRGNNDRVLTRHATSVRQGNWFSVGIGPE